MRVVFLLSSVVVGLAGGNVFPFVGDDSWAGAHNVSPTEDSVRLLNLAGVRGLVRTKQLVYLEEALQRRGQEAMPGTPDHTYQSLQTGSSYSAFLTRGALSQLEATKHSADDVDLNADFVSSFYDTVLDFTCYSRNVTCEESSYRTFDGICNNLRNPLWGMADTPLERLHPAAYGDGMWSSASSSTGAPLPSPRLVSLSMATGVRIPSQRVNQLFVAFAHFVGHDLALTPTYKMKNQKTLSCCTPHGDSTDSRLSHEACFPIAIPEDDPFYGRFSVTCMNFVRSAIAPKLSCLMGSAEQLNSVSHYLDASPIYGVTDSQGTRSYKHGMLEVQSLGYEDFLPLRLNSDDECGDPLKAVFCFLSGDLRVNQFVASTALYILFAREHNRVARFLTRINPHWNDERVFQQSRRIVTAVLQHITYSEFLPAIISPSALNRSSLSPLVIGHTEYDPTVNPSISNEFATSAFRFFHSMVPGTVHLANDTGSTISGTSLHYHVNNPKVFYHPHGLDHLLRSSSENNVESCHVDVVYELKHRLYQGSAPWGLDLMAIDIQRGRDHGLPSYTRFLRLCANRRVLSFRDLDDLVPTDLLELLEHIYYSVHDIDPLVGMLAERPVVDSLLGPTVQCVISDQFARLKLGDRFYYEHSGPHAFNHMQLQEIRKSSLASLLCSNTASITTTPLKGFLLVGKNNPLYPCHKLPRPNLLLWKEPVTGSAFHPRGFY